MAEPVANGIPQLDKAICDRLKVRIPGLAVESFPDNPETFRLMHAAGALLVQYVGGDYEEDDDLSHVGQARELRFNVHVLARSLAGHQGAYVHLEAVRLALGGYRVPAFKKLRLQRERFVSRKEGVWIYATTVRTRTLAVELDPESADVFLQQATITSNFTDENEVSVG